MKRNPTTHRDVISSVREILESDYLKETNLLNFLPLAVYICDRHGEVVNYNTKAIELWGRTPQKGERFSGAFKLYRADGTFLPQDQTPAAACFTDGLSRENLDLIIERPDLSRIIVRVNIAPVMDDQGEILGLINCFYDITQQKKTEKELDWKTRELQDYVDNAAIGLHWVDSNGIIIWANKAELNMLGYTKEEYIGHHIADFHVNQENITDILNRLSCNETLNGYETELKCKDGSIKTVQISSNVFWDEGKFIHTRCFTIDITEQKKLFNALKESEAQYRHLLNSQQSALHTSEERYHKMIEEVEDYAIILLDKDGIVQNWNKGAEKIKGYKEEEIVGKSFSNFYLPEDRQNGLPQKLLNNARVNGKAIHEGWRLRKDGSRFWGSIVLTALHDVKKNIIGFSKVTRDLTEKKMAEDKMQDYTSQLEFQNRELEQFAYAASHDMKEPLRKIHLYNSAILENPANTLDPISKEYLNRSLNAAKRMKGLIDDLLTYSRTTSTAENFESVDLTAIIKELNLLNKEEFGHKKIHIDTDNLPVINAVSFQIRQLMYNLISNSIKYKHPDRDVRIQFRSELVDGREISSQGADPILKYYRISVSDNGIGFKPQYAEKIFDIFQRLNNMPGTKGSGIGLAICKRIVQNHHGFIVAKGKENQGARFDIYLPADL